MDIWLSSPHFSGKEINYIQDLLQDNSKAPITGNLELFEKKLAKGLEIKSVAALASGTSAIHLALRVLGIQEKDEVLCPSFTFSASINPILYEKAIPIFVDCEAKTWNINPDLLEKAIQNRIKKGKKPKALILVHVYGMPAQMAEINKITQNYEIPIIEDAAEAMGSTYEGKALGTFGEMGIISFNVNKIITTTGGGVLISDNEKHIQKVKKMATQARDLAPHYQHSELGFNYRMSNILAGIGLAQLQVLEKRIEARRNNFFYYKKQLSGMDGIEFLEAPNEKYFSNHWLTCILLNPKKIKTSANNLRITLEKNKIESRPLWKPMHQQPFFKDFPFYGSGLSDNLFQQGLCLPSSSSLTQNDLDKIIEKIQLEILK